MTVSLSRRRACSTLALAALAAATPWSVWAQGDTEPFEVNDFDWLDPRRQRPVPVRLYWPAGLAADARVPLVVFSHGIGGSRRGYSYLGSHWASHGYASLHLQHVGSDRSLWSGNVFSLVGRLQNPLPQLRRELVGPRERVGHRHPAHADAVRDRLQCHLGHG